MTANITNRKRIDRFVYFFPFQLLMLHLQRSHFVLLFWILLFAFITQNFATKFGVPFLFLAPEYQGVVGVWSFGILGFGLGGFVMAYNIYTYIEHAHRFPFLGTLSRPFFKFCVNNSIIPLLFAAVYIYTSSRFLLEVELKNPGEVVANMASFLFGNVLFIMMAMLYFFPTNKNIFKITGITESEIDAHMRKRNSGLRRKDRWYFSKSGKVKWRVETYLTHPFKINLARPSDHYDHETLRKVFFQNHVNASLFEILVVIVFFIVGAFQFNSIFVIPAAASACLVFTVALMSVSILMSWTKSWTFALLFLLLFLINSASSRYDILNMANFAYGLDYSKPPIAYNNATIDSLNGNLNRVRADMDHHEEVLNIWLDKQRKKRGDREYKPVMVLVNTSGGGLRSSLWTVLTMQYCDSITNGAFFENTRLISGSSGGTIGAAYFRELYLYRDSISEPLYSSVYRNNVSKDILNRVLFSLATNDIFIRFRHREIAGYNYVLDRGMTFEEQLNINTGFMLNKRISDLEVPVRNAEIPMMVLAPSVVNDGRRLLISSQPISYLCYDYPEVKSQLNLAYENIEFNRLFAGHDANNLLLTSALRMNSTFPYVLPYASLPTEPRIEVMDAGLRDNFGTKISVQYMYTFKKWIEKNTEGIVILQIRDTEKYVEPSGSNPTIVDKLLNPIGSFYGNYFNDQDYNLDQLVKMTDASFGVPIYQLPLEIKYNPGEQIALSWHLTALEKEKVLRSIDQPSNQQTLKRLQAILNR
jgi:hypothetical protein